ncbi:hypothetical protein AJ85_17875 [Alkalihalobacillus alcalophilus ATCC 27647 = CGMCC 1.3604]|uniref:Uncharacterized protein n=1 Tax=Alkalihalobacillus alcalophilus ATCC 27647 = CGMCC 1.3604 TaxID=1218173 RepID=A0A094WP87_ALKAL|nr:type II toxin-antitoxin system SpoIISA family toxin [Alkalihalobacillus alcalophilus]KGA98646.1 hypothetical protein BALCAV_0203215 [Alkalihalobacillus alcalophilus ATCC 27647 = CGMCC 1.3604]MED1564279.1 type II toxin-antitoxin system SpoIISA family toxin [Alkalihalobacillus alcalophilus]THG89404.1 hypothetical protein AJ85_17875 [Alkalihalobacillus alcalophilus ATCC 27647 = CGMCC 1.3604]
MNLKDVLNTSRNRMKKLFNLNVLSFLGVFVALLLIPITVSITLIYHSDISFLFLLLGTTSIMLIFILAYYWINSRGFYNNLGRIRRTYYTMFIVLIVVGFIFKEIEFSNWIMLIQLTFFAIFIDLAVFQNPNILKIWNAELKHEDEIREALLESKEIIVKNSKKVEKFSDVIQKTDSYLLERPIPKDSREYEEQLKEYTLQYSSSLGFKTGLFLFESTENQETNKENIDKKFQDICVRHGNDVSQKNKNDMVETLLSGQTIILKENKLIAIPYYGDIYSMLITIEGVDVVVDGVDASHILNMIVIFDWYMIDATDDL